MRTNKPVPRWGLFVGYLWVLGMLLACSIIGVAPKQTASPSSGDVQIQVEDNIVEVQTANGNWIPVAGGSFFNITAELESTDPLSAGGIDFETNAETQIEEGLEVGDLVRIQGFILEDGTWLANSIELAEEQIDPIIVLIGIVDSVDPWVVNGIELNVTEETEIQGEISPGMFVRVEILLLPDGTWDVISIAPLGDPEDIEGCVTIVATVLRVEGDEIQLSGWPKITLGEDIEIEANLDALSEGQVVLLVICPSDEGQIVLIQIIVIDNGEIENAVEGEKVLVCHKPDKRGGHTLSIAAPAVPAHLRHGDTLGPCP